MVTEDLRAASRNRDSDEDLLARLNECPIEMNDLFQCLLERQDKFYRKHPKPYLRLILTAARHDINVTMLELLLASGE